MIRFSAVFSLLRGKVHCLRSIGILVSSDAGLGQLEGHLPDAGNLLDRGHRRR